MASARTPNATREFQWLAISHVAECGTERGKRASIHRQGRARLEGANLLRILCRRTSKVVSFFVSFFPSHLFPVFFICLRIDLLQGLCRPFLLDELDYQPVGNWSARSVVPNCRCPNPIVLTTNRPSRVFELDNTLGMALTIGLMHRRKCPGVHVLGCSTHPWAAFTLAVQAPNLFVKGFKPQALVPICWSLDL